MTNRSLNCSVSKANQNSPLVTNFYTFTPMNSCPLCSLALSYLYRNDIEIQKMTIRNYTAAEIKEVLNNAGDRSSFVFAKNNPYFANDERIKAMVSRWERFQESHIDMINSRTFKSIENWLQSFRDKYL